MKINTLTLTAFTAILSTHAYAETLWPILETKRCAPVVTLSLGPAVTGGIDSETFYLQSEIEKTFKVDRTPHAFGSGELFLGWQIPMNANLLGQIGLAVAAGLQAPLSGDIWEDADPNFNNYSYKYKVNHTQVAVKAKVLTDINTIIQPYVSGSVGLGINKAYDFTITPKIFPEVPAPDFTARSGRGLAYTAGLGIQTAYKENWEAGIGYEFADWGHTQLGRAPGQTLNSGLGGSHLFTHELQFSLTYVFTSGPRRA